MSNILSLKSFTRTLYSQFTYFWFDNIEQERKGRREGGKEGRKGRKKEVKREWVAES